MAFQFNGTDEDGTATLNLSGASTLAITVSVWLNRTSNDAAEVMLEHSTNYNNFDDGFIFVSEADADMSFGYQDSTTGTKHSEWIVDNLDILTNGTWGHYLIRMDKSLGIGGDRTKVWVNGVAKGFQGLDTANQTTNFGDHTLHFGARSSSSLWWDGQIAELAIYNGDISGDAGAVAALAGAASPLLVRPNDLLAYYPMTRGGQNLISGNSITNNGTVSASPPIYQPSAQIIPFPPAAAPPAGSYTIYNNYYRQLLAGNV